jgi:hypothetical protein
VREFQNPACCVLMAKDMRAVMEVLVQECGWGGVARCRNWSVTGRMLAQLSDEVRWFRCRGQYLAGDSQGLAVHDLSH